MKIVSKDKEAITGFLETLIERIENGVVVDCRMETRTGSTFREAEDSGPIVIASMEQKTVKFMIDYVNMDTEEKIKPIPVRLAKGPRDGETIFLKKLTHFISLKLHHHGGLRAEYWIDANDHSRYLFAGVRLGREDQSQDHNIHPDSPICESLMNDTGSSKAKQSFSPEEIRGNDSI